VAGADRPDHPVKQPVVATIGVEQRYGFVVHAEISRGPSGSEQRQGRTYDNIYQGSSQRLVIMLSINVPEPRAPIVGGSSNTQ
jgi:hypothetical protein